MRCRLVMGRLVMGRVMVSRFWHGPTIGDKAPV
jgi:hypothetical protein